MNKEQWDIANLLCHSVSEPDPLIEFIKSQPVHQNSDRRDALIFGGLIFVASILNALSR